jgi:hypothetical protein
MQLERIVSIPIQACARSAVSKALPQAAPLFTMAILAPHNSLTTILKNQGDTIFLEWILPIRPRIPAIKRRDFLCIANLEGREELPYVRESVWGVLERD